MIWEINLPPLKVVTAHLEPQILHRGGHDVTGVINETPAKVIVAR
jgi:hypothetical protein